MAKKVKKMAFGGMSRGPQMSPQGSAPSIGMPMVPPGAGGMGAMGRMGGAPSPMAQNLMANQAQRMAMMQRSGMIGGPTFNSQRPAPMGVSGMNSPRMSLSKLAGFRGIGRPGGMKKGGSVVSASKRADGIATKGKTKGRII